MRKASVAIVPLLLAVMALFWFIWFMGGANDNLHKVNEIENLQRLQARLLPAAMKRYIEYQEIKSTQASDADTPADKKLTEEQVQDCVTEYIHSIMIGNDIDENAPIPDLVLDNCS